MAHPYAVLDTVAVVLLCTKKQGDSPDERLKQQWRECTREWVEHLTPRVRFAIPTAVIAELGYPHPPKVFLEELASALGRFRALPLTRGGGETAALMAAERLKERQKKKTPDEARGAVKFDTLIAATAHVFGAKYVLTHNKRDFRRPLAVVGSSVEVIDATAGRPGQQIAMPIPLKPVK